MKAALLLGSLWCVGSAFSAYSNAGDDSNLLKFTEEEVSRDLEMMEAREKKLQNELAVKIKTYHSYQNGAGQPRYVWDEEALVEKKRASLKKILGLSIQSGLKMLAFLQDQRAALMNERELLLVEKERASGATTSSRSFLHGARESFACRQFPVSAQDEIKSRLLEDFGLKNDKETGVSWRSQGWWIGHPNAQVRSCADGEVAFSGNIEGRGWVVMLDHGQSVMTVYANLIPETVNQLVQKGQKIAAGTVIGSIKEKVYFEARFEGKSVDPKKVLGSQSLREFNL